ncbi:MAG: hypothetical protein QOJ65_2595 [Fimbriimonadaceae bacterium]|jgi:hypothetical protein|nr:hypothetical protein [Fimbriimonadaceae bacterium]
MIDSPQGVAATPAVSIQSRLRINFADDAPKRTAPFDAEPGYYRPAGLWLYGNAKLLWARLVHIPEAAGPNSHRPKELEAIASQAEAHVLNGRVLVCGIHNAAHQRAAVVPLRWGSPRIVVFSGGFRYHLGKELNAEAFRAARLWRYCWDPQTDLAISRRAPEKLPTFASHNRTVDRMIALLAKGEWPGLNSPLDSLTAPLECWEKDS